MKNNKKTKNIKITNLVMSLGVATTIIGTIASGVGISQTQNNNEGVVSHDANTLLQMNSGNSKVLPSDAQLTKLGITTICEDGKGGFYVGGKNNMFEHFDSEGNLLDSKDIQAKITFDISSITLDSNGGVIISGSNAAQVHLDSKGQILKSFNFNDEFKAQGEIINSLTSKDGKTYVVGNHGLMSIFDENGDELKTVNLGLNTNVKTMIENENSIVLGTEQGDVLFLNKTTNKVSSVKVNSPVVSIQENDGGVFVQTETKSLEISIDGEISSSQDLNVFKNGTITNVVSTKDGYIATGTNGHVALLNNDFKVVSQSVVLESKTINAIVKDDESGFYIAGEKGLVSHINSNGVEDSEEVKTLLDGSDIYGMQRNDQGHIFVFGNSFKVEELDDQGKTIKHFNLLGVSSVNTAATKTDGEIIFGGEIKTTKVWDSRIESVVTSDSPLVATPGATSSRTITSTLLQNNDNHVQVNKFDYDLKSKETINAKDRDLKAVEGSAGSNITNGYGADFLEDSHGNLWSVGYGTPLQFSSDKGITWTVDAASKITDTGHFKTLFQDDHGFIWIMGNKNPLMKFTYSSPTSNTGTWVEQDATVTGSNITNGYYGTIFQDSRGVLWTVGYNSWPQRYDYKTSKWTPLTIASKLNKGNGIYPKFTEDSHHTLWYRADGAPIQKSVDGGDTWTQPTPITNSQGGFVYEDSNGTLWIGGVGPLQKSLDNGETFIPAGKDNAITSAQWGTVFEDSHGFLWAIGNGSGLQVSEDGGDTWTVQNASNSNSNIVNGWASNIFEDSSGTLWSSGRDTPLQKYDYNTEEWTPETLADNNSTVTSGWESLIYEDSYHNLWTASRNTGLQVKNIKSKKWDTIPFKQGTPPRLTNSLTATMFEDSQHRMWLMGVNTILQMSTDNGNNWTDSIGEYIAGTGSIIEDEKSKTLYAFVSYPNTTVTTRPVYGATGITSTRVSKTVMYKLPKNSLKWEIDTTSNIGNATNAVMTKDANGTLWSIGNGTHLQHLVAGTSSWVEDSSLAVVGNTWPSIFSDSRKRLWVISGTALNYTDDFGKTWETVKNFALPRADKAMIQEDSSGKLWVSCSHPSIYGSPNIVYGTTYVYTFFSIDGGNTWDVIDSSSFAKFNDGWGNPGEPASRTFSGGDVRVFRDTYGTTWAITGLVDRRFSTSYGSDMYPFVAPIYKSPDDGKTWTPLPGTDIPYNVDKRSVSATCTDRTFFEDSKGTLWITNYEGIHYSVDKGATWKKSGIKFTTGSRADLRVRFYEDSNNKLWIFTSGFPPQSIDLSASGNIYNAERETKGTFSVNAYMQDYKMHLGFVGANLLKESGIDTQYKVGGGAYQILDGNSLQIDTFGTYTFKFVLNSRGVASKFSTALPASFSVTFNDGDGIITNPKVSTEQPKVSGDLGTFDWGPFTNPLHATLKYFVGKTGTLISLPQEGGSFDKQNPGSEMHFKWELDPTYTWANKKPTDPDTQIVAAVGIGDLVQKSTDAILKQITDWKDTPFDFSKYTLFGFTNSCPDSKQTITVVSDTKISASFEFSLIPTADDEFHYEVTKVTISDIKAPIAETLMPSEYATLKALTHEFTGLKNKFKTIQELIAPILNSEFRIDPFKLPSSVIDAKNPTGTYTYVDPNKLFSIVFTPNNEDGKVHYVVTETGSTAKPIEDDLSGFYSYKKMGAALAPSDIVKLLKTSLGSFNFKEYTKELFNAASNKVNQTKKIVHKINGYTLDFTFSIKATKQDELEYGITSFDVKDGTKVLASALNSPELKPISTTKDTMQLENGNKFTTFQEMVAKLLKSDGSKIATQAVKDIPNIVKPVAPAKTYDYIYPKFKITFTPDDIKKCVNWVGVSTVDATIKGSGIVSGFHEITNISTDDFRTILLSSGWYDLYKLPSTTGQPKQGDVHKIKGLDFTLQVSKSDISGEMTFEADYVDEVATPHHVGPIKIFGFKDLSSKVTATEIHQAVESKIASAKTNGVFDRTTDKLPSEVYISVDGYEIKAFVYYSFVDGTISYEAFLPNGNSLRGSLKNSAGTSTGFPSEVKDNIWDSSGVVTPGDTLGDVIRVQLKADGVNHDQLPSTVKTTITKINLERGFDFSDSKIVNAFVGYTSKKINGQYSIVYNNATKNLQVIDTTSVDIVGSPVVMKGNLINAFSYDSTHVILIESGIAGKCAHIQFVDMSTGTIESEKDVDNGAVGVGLTAIKQVSPGKFIYQDSTKKLHFLLFDMNANEMVASEMAIVDTKDATDLANFNLVDLATLNPLQNGNFVIVGNDQYYEVKINGITISIVNKETASAGVQIKQIGDNEFLLEDGTAMWLASFVSGTGFVFAQHLPFAAKVDISNAIRINDEYVVVKSGAKIYKINTKTAEMIDITPTTPTDLPVATSNMFINIGNRGVLYPTSTGAGIMKVLTDGFYEAIVSPPKADDSNGALVFNAQFLGKTITYVDTGYWKEINAHAKDIPSYLKVIGDNSNFKIDESGLPPQIADHAHLEYSLDGTTWVIYAKLKIAPAYDLEKLVVKYVADPGYVIKDTSSVNLFKAGSTLDDTSQQKALEDLAKNSKVDGSVIKAVLSGVDKSLFAKDLDLAGMKLMIRIGGATGIWTEFDVDKADAELLQIFDNNGINQGTSTTQIRYSFNELYDQKLLSIDLKIQPTDPTKRLKIQKVVHISDYSHVKVLTHINLDAVDKTKVKVTGTENNLVFSETGAIDATKLNGIKMGIKYSLTGGAKPTESMLRDMFGLTKTEPFAQLKNLMTLFDQHQWFTKDEYENDIKPKLNGLSLCAESLLAKFDSSDPNIIFGQLVTEPFKTSGLIINYRDVSKLSGKIVDLENHLIGTNYNLQVELPKELLPETLAQYGKDLKVRDGVDLVEDKGFGLILQYSIDNGKTWQTIKDVKGNMFVFPRSSTEIKHLSMHLCPVEVANGVITDWNNIISSTDRTLIDSPSKSVIQPSKPVDISLQHIEKINIISLSKAEASALHFNDEETPAAKAEPKMPTYKFSGTENGKLTVSIVENGIPKNSEVLVQWLRPIKNANGPDIDLKDGSPIIGYEMYIKDSSGKFTWMKVAEVLNGKLNWLYIDYNNLDGSWIDYKDVHLSVGDHLRFRLHTTGVDNKFQWEDYSFNDYSEMIYSENHDPKNNQADFGVLVDKIIFKPSFDTSKVDLVFHSLDGKNNPQDWAEKAANAINPSDKDKWMWHYTVMDGKTKVGEYDNKIPDNSLKNGMIIKMKIIPKDESAYKIDDSFVNKFKDIIISWPIEMGVGITKLSLEDFKFEGTSGKGKLVKNMPKEISDAKLLYNVVSNGKIVETTNEIPEDLRNEEDVIITIDPSNTNEQVDLKDQLKVPVSGLVKAESIEPVLVYEAIKIYPKESTTFKRAYIIFGSVLGVVATGGLLLFALKRRRKREWELNERFPEDKE